MSQVQIPPLAEGEIYLCGLVDANGDVEHTVLLPGDCEPAPWNQQMESAKSADADLLNAIEFAVARLKFPEQFKEEAYWMNEEVSWDTSCARYQHFGYGYQDRSHKSARLRARRVRRFKN